MLKPKNCKDIKDFVPSLASGVYEIEVDGEKLEVRCEMNSASGGWTVSLFSSWKYLTTPIEQVLVILCMFIKLISF